MKFAWQEWDEAALKRLYAEGLSDTEIGRRMLRHPNTIGPRRRKLGPPHGKPGGPFGWKHTSEARAKVSKANAERWKNNERIRLTLLDNLKRGPECAKLRSFAPARGTPEYRLYRNIRTNLRRFMHAILEPIHG